MNEVFLKYANYYDIINEGKNYQLEADKINDIIKSKDSKAISVLDLGCGSGIHANYLANMGFEVTGVDFSSEMIAIANKKRENEYSLNKHRLNFIQGDIRSIELGKQFDVIISMFHVFSYLNSNIDLSSAYSVINKHLKLNGIFIYDFWYGPGVLNELPSIKIKNIKSKNLEIKRIAYPQLDVNKNLVVVNYEFYLIDNNNNSVNRINESHSMRYFFYPELQILHHENNLKILEFYDPKTIQLPKLNSWNGLIVSKKIDS